MLDKKVTNAEGPGTSYRYPLPAPNVIDTTGVLDRTQTGGVTANSWTISLDNPLGRAVFTSPALANQSRT